MKSPDDNFPTPSTDNEANFRYPHSGPLGPDPQREMIGGTYRVSTKIDPEQALTGAFQPIIGDCMPSGAPVDGTPPYTTPYLPKN